MKQYKLGPNGGIVTSLNLFATRFDQVMGFIEKRSEEHKLDYLDYNPSTNGGVTSDWWLRVYAHTYRYIIFDTPGQIEVFTWSASGTIITETLVGSFIGSWLLGARLLAVCVCVDILTVDCSLYRRQRFPRWWCM